MTDPREFMRKARDLRDKAEHEDDAGIRARLHQMADDYAHLAESEANKVSHPVDVAAIGDILSKGS